MSFELCFTEDFFLNENEDNFHLGRPISVFGAIEAMILREPEKWKNLKKEIFDLDNGIYLDSEIVLEKIRETNTCSNLTVPVEVWIDPDGYYTLQVWDKYHLDLENEE